MKTEVETFIIEETQELIHDNDQLEKWNGLVAELGLVGQTKIVKKDKSPVPYLFMNSGLVAVFTELCPKKVNIEAYDRTPIPVEILSLVSLSKKDEHFHKIQIWSNEKNPDPVCVGMIQNENYNASYGDWHTAGWNHYLIGRWADVKASLDTLAKRARAMFIANATSEAQSNIRTQERRLLDLEIEADRKFGAAMPETDLPF